MVYRYQIRVVMPHNKKLIVLAQRLLMVLVMDVRHDFNEMTTVFAPRALTSFTFERVFKLTDS